MNIQFHLVPLIRVIVISCTLFGLAYAASAQEDSSASPRVFMIRDYQVAEITTQPGVISTQSVSTLPIELEALGSSRTDAWRLDSADITRDARLLYSIETFGRTSRLLPTNTRLVRTDLLTGTRLTLIENSGLYTFTMSPDETKMFVTYYDGEYGVDTIRTCLLDLVSGECRTFPFAVIPPRYWIDNNYIVAIQVPGLRLTIININDFSYRELALPPELYLYSAVPIPGTRYMVLSMTIRDNPTLASQFKLLNVDTGELSDMLYNALNQENYSAVGNWTFSPDGFYLLYQGGGELALIEFAAGRLITEIDTGYNWGWTSDTTLVLQGSDGNMSGVLEIDATTGGIRQLLPASEANGILLVTHPQ
ncbi:MAG: hypothetical protein SF123_26125 [Chloroflexota bacterium]|nr:hypothetical protein [Chloroflexota bacterium]